MSLPLVRPRLNLARIVSRAVSSSPIRQFSDQETVPLAFDLVEPSRTSVDGRFTSTTEPILFLHGFMGSKKNNRSISK